MNPENVITLGNVKYDKSKIPPNLQQLIRSAEYCLENPHKVEAHEDSHDDYDKENTNYCDVHHDHPSGSGCGRHTDNTAFLGHVDRYG
jgi:hypothetical protein